tara:strand:- start:179 stop:772 length:594 start_codon:yes stop_codon:yes gene_type:complete
MFVTKKNEVIIKKISKIIARSTVEQGDQFSMICYNDDIKNNYLLEPGNNFQYINKWIDGIIFDTDKSSSNRIEDINKYLPEEKSLVFFISDFHYIPEKIDKILRQFSNHHVIPIFISSEDEIKKLPNYGFRRFVDSELDLEYEVFLRPNVKNKILADYEEMKIKIFNIFSKNQLKQIVINGDINIKTIQKYFLGTYI